MFANKIILENAFAFEAGGSCTGMQIVYHTSMRNTTGKPKLFGSAML